MPVTPPPWVWLHFSTSGFLYTNGDMRMYLQLFTVCEALGFVPMPHRKCWIQSARQYLLANTFSRHITWAIKTTLFPLETSLMQALYKTMVRMCSLSAAVPGVQRWKDPGPAFKDLGDWRGIWCERKAGRCARGSGGLSRNRAESSGDRSLYGRRWRGWSRKG